MQLAFRSTGQHLGDKRPAFVEHIKGKVSGCFAQCDDAQVVSLLVSRGLSIKAVSEELGLSDNTVRSHLRAIYAKTETASLSELIYLILSVTEEDDMETVAAFRA